MKKQELKELIASGKPVRLLDVREKGEFEHDGKVEGSENVPMGQVFVNAARGELPKDEKIVAICKTGGRCGVVAKELKEKGYDIEYLEGGIEEWNKED